LIGVWVQTGDHCETHRRRTGHSRCAGPPTASRQMTSRGAHPTDVEEVRGSGQGDLTKRPTNVQICRDPTGASFRRDSDRVTSPPLMHGYRTGSRIEDVGLLLVRDPLSGGRPPVLAPIVIRETGCRALPVLAGSAAHRMCAVIRRGPGTCRGAGRYAWRECASIRRSRRQRGRGDRHRTPLFRVGTRPSCRAVRSSHHV
jgi:hypothetical protein